MKRVLLDTNIYEFILKEIDREALERLVEKKTIVIYGNNIIRRELRAISDKKTAFIGDKVRKLRIALLSLYDLLVRKTYEIDRNERILAEKYYTVFKSLGGVNKKEEIINDFLIVSSATLKNLDIVVSEDNKTMLSEFALKAYEVVNKLEKKRTPQFIGFGDLKKEVRRYGSL